MCDSDPLAFLLGDCCGCCEEDARPGDVTPPGDLVWGAPNTAQFPPPRTRPRLVEEDQPFVAPTADFDSLQVPISLRDGGTYAPSVVNGQPSFTRINATEAVDASRFPVNVAGRWYPYEATSVNHVTGVVTFGVHRTNFTTVLNDGPTPDYDYSWGAMAGAAALDFTLRPIGTTAPTAGITQGTAPDGSTTHTGPGFSVRRASTPLAPAKEFVETYRTNGSTNLHQDAPITWNANGTLSTPVGPGFERRTTLNAWYPLEFMAEVWSSVPDGFGGFMGQITAHAPPTNLHWLASWTYGPDGEPNLEQLQIGGYVDNGEVVYGSGGIGTVVNDPIWRSVLPKPPNGGAPGSTVRTEIPWSDFYAWNLDVAPPAETITTGSLTVGGADGQTYTVTYGVGSKLPGGGTNFGLAYDATVDVNGTVVHEGELDILWCLARKPDTATNDLGGIDLHVLDLFERHYKVFSNGTVTTGTAPPGQVAQPWAHYDLPNITHRISVAGETWHQGTRYDAWRDRSPGQWRTAGRSRPRTRALYQRAKERPGFIEPVSTYPNFHLAGQFVDPDARLSYGVMPTAQATTCRLLPSRVETPDPQDPEAWMESPTLLARMLEGKPVSGRLRVTFQQAVSASPADCVRTHVIFRADVRTPAAAAKIHGVPFAPIGITAATEPRTRGRHPAVAVVPFALNVATDELRVVLLAPTPIRSLHVQLI